MRPSLSILLLSWQSVLGGVHEQIPLTVKNERYGIQARMLFDTSASLYVNRSNNHVVNVACAILTKIHFSGVRVALNWVNPETGEARPFSELEKNQKFEMGTFKGHQFEIHEIPSEDTGVCESSEDQTCKFNRFVISEKDRHSELEKEQTLSQNLVTTLSVFI